MVNSVLISLPKMTPENTIRKKASEKKQKKYAVRKKRKIRGARKFVFLLGGFFMLSFSSPKSSWTELSDQIVTSGISAQTFDPLGVLRGLRNLIGTFQFRARSLALARIPSRLTDRIGTLGI